MVVEAAQVKQILVGTLKVQVYPTRASASAAAATAAAREMQRLARETDLVSVIFATGASQLAALEALTQLPNLPWEKIRGFHLDEYVGLAITHPASFRGYLRKNLTDKVKMADFFEIDGTADAPERVCREYAAKLRSSAPKLCLLGIGENGHLAFNDPGVASFEDPEDVKTVVLDEVCRKQQWAEGWFTSLEDVPTRAITLTIPTVLRVPTLIASVVGNRKAAILRRTLSEPISTDCPATIMRVHPGATVYADEDAAAELGAFFS